MNWRMVVTLSMFFLGIAVAVSGFALYVGPPGSLKQARLLGLTRTQWSDLHTAAAFAAVALALFHIWFNRRALITYFRRISFLEAVAVAIIVALFVVTPPLDLPPGSWIASLGESLEAGWAQSYHGTKGFGFMTLQEFSQNYNVPLQKILSYLETKYGINVSPTTYLKDIADEIGTTPSALASELLALKESAASATITTSKPLQTQTAQRPQSGQGYGMMTLRQFCETYNIPLNEAIAFIKQKYGVNVTPDMTIRDIAFSVGLKPYDLAQELMSLRR